LPLSSIAWGESRRRSCRTVGGIIASIAALALAGGAWAADFRTQATSQDRRDSDAGDWTLPTTWKNAAGKQGVPATSSDVGIIGYGHQLSVLQKPLGTPADRPTIRVETGGVLDISCVEMVNPLELAGGFTSGNWGGAIISAPITVTADSSLISHGDGVAELHLVGPVANTKLVTLHCAGAIEWLSDSSKTFTGTIAVDRGVVYINNPAGSRAMGTGLFRIGAGALVVMSSPLAKGQFHFENDLCGIGSVYAADGKPQNMLTTYGITITPGMLPLPGEPGTSTFPFGAELPAITGTITSPGKPTASDMRPRPGTLAIDGSVDFHRSADGKPNELVIYVGDDPSAPPPGYGQLAITGNLTNSLDNVDLVVRLPSDMTPRQAAMLDLVVMSAENGADIARPNFHPFHSVTIAAGKKKASAAVKFFDDPLTGKGMAEVTGITFQ
jgi:hypothetical protein